VPLSNFRLATQGCQHLVIPAIGVPFCWRRSTKVQHRGLLFGIPRRGRQPKKFNATML
jgi:hypothetical protein